MSDDLEAQLAADRAREAAERAARDVAAAQALADAQKAIDQSGVSIPPGAWGIDGQGAGSPPEDVRHDEDHG